MESDEDPKTQLDNVYGIMHYEGKAPYSIARTEEFDDWFDTLPPKTQAIVISRLAMIAVGHFGDHKRFDGLLEFRWRNGNRVYGFFYGSSIVVALYGGNKNAQDRDIRKAKKIRNEILTGIRPLQQP